MALASDTAPSELVTEFLGRVLGETIRFARRADETRDRTAIGTVWDAERWVQGQALQLGLTVTPIDVAEPQIIEQIPNPTTPVVQAEGRPGFYPHDLIAFAHAILKGKEPREALRKTDPEGFRQASRAIVTNKEGQKVVRDQTAVSVKWKASTIVLRTQLINEGYARLDELTPEDWKLYRAIKALGPEVEWFKTFDASAGMVKALRGRSKTVTGRERIPLADDGTLLVPIQFPTLELRQEAEAKAEPLRLVEQLPKWVGKDPRKELPAMPREICCAFRAAFGAKKIVLTPGFIVERATDTRALDERTVDKLMREHWRRFEYVMSDDPIELTDEEALLRSNLQSRYGSKSTLAAIITLVGRYSFRPHDFDPVTLILKAKGWESDAARQAQYSRVHGHYVMSTGGPRGRSVIKRGH